MTIRNRLADLLEIPDKKNDENDLVVQRLSQVCML